MDRSCVSEAFRKALPILGIGLACIAIGGVLLFGSTLFGSTQRRTGPLSMVVCHSPPEVAVATCSPAGVVYCHAGINVPDPHLKSDGTDHLCSVDELRRYEAR